MLKEIAPGLYQYVVRKILAAADAASPTGSRTPETTKTAFRAAFEGLTDGWWVWDKMKTTSGMLVLYNTYSEDVVRILLRFATGTDDSPWDLKLCFYHEPTLKEVFISLTPLLDGTGEDTDQHWNCYAGLTLAIACVITAASFEYGVSI